MLAAIITNPNCWCQATYQRVCIYSWYFDLYCCYYWRNVKTKTLKYSELFFLSRTILKPFQLVQLGGLELILEKNLSRQPSCSVSCSARIVLLPWKIKFSVLEVSSFPPPRLQSPNCSYSIVPPKLLPLTFGNPTECPNLPNFPHSVSLSDFPFSLNW